MSTSCLATSTSLKVLSKKEGLKHLKVVVLCFSFSYPIHKPKDRNGLWGQGCRVDPRYAKPQIKQNCAGPRALASINVSACT